MTQSLEKLTLGGGEVFRKALTMQLPLRLRLLVSALLSSQDARALLRTLHTQPSHAVTCRQVYREVRALVAPVIPDRSGTKFPVLPQVSANMSYGFEGPQYVCCRSMVTKCSGSL